MVEDGRIEDAKTMLALMIATGSGGNGRGKGGNNSPGMSLNAAMRSGDATDTSLNRGKCSVGIAHRRVA